MGVRRVYRGRGDGFSAIEVIIVMMIIAIAAAMVLPRLGQTAATQLREAGKLVVADLEYARSAAIAHGSDPRMVVFEPGEDRYHVAARSSPQTAVEAPGVTGKYHVEFGQGRARSLDAVRLDSTDLTDNELKFDMYGGTTRPADKGDAHITLRCKGHTLTITVDRVTGTATMSELQ